MDRALLVPVHVDALHLKKSASVVGPMANFSLLPYKAKNNSHINDIPNLSSNIRFKPFQQKNLNLKPGIHFHWTLPSALKEAEHQPAQDTKKAQLVFPAVPNRWLITRSSIDTTGKRIISGEWVVESDYLHPNGKGKSSGSITYPIKIDRKPGKVPYRHLGRTLKLANWKESDSEAEYLDKLTAIGYGEATFSALYANCHSVFGFLDAEFEEDIPNDLQYEVVGFYSTIELDCLSQFINGKRERLKSNGQLNQSEETRHILDRLNAEFEWRLDEAEETESLPTQMICYGRIHFQAEAASEKASEQKPDIQITLANSGTEALSTYLANSISPEKAAELEDQLEAVNFAERLEENILDLGANFEAARHEKSFRAVNGGIIWRIQAESKEDRTPEHRTVGSELKHILPADLAKRLHNLNELQRQYERLLNEIETRRWQTYSDWCKFMSIAYGPDPRPTKPLNEAHLKKKAKPSKPLKDRRAEIKRFIDKSSLKPLEEALERCGKLLFSYDPSGRLHGAAASGVNADSLVQLMAAEINYIIGALNTHNLSEHARECGMQFTLKPMSGPRFWQPQEPVVLLAGKKLIEQLRSDNLDNGLPDGTLDCFLIDITPGLSINDQIRSLLKPLRSKIEEIAANATSSRHSNGFNIWHRESSHPIILAWQTEFLPVAEKKQTTGNSDYSTGFLDNNFQLLHESDPATHQTAIELVPAREDLKINKNARLFSGFTILSNQSGVSLRLKLAKYLEKQLLPLFFNAEENKSEQKTDTYFRENSEKVINWFKNNACKSGQEDPLCNIIAAYEKLTDPDFHYLSQSLSGFNEALLMHEQAYQLPIEDPFGLKPYVQFAERIQHAIVGKLRSSPRPLNDFTPLRTGELEIHKLSLIDSFGRETMLYSHGSGSPKNDEKQEFLIPHTLKSSYFDRAWLAPRFAQPARINFRLLAADMPSVEVSEHPATNPICGWLISNNLDNSLMVYNNQGEPLGSINQHGVWDAPPGTLKPLFLQDIPNAHLKELISHIMEHGPEFLQAFLTALNSSIEKIDPENYRRFQSRALLMSRPIAVVRASLGLELNGLPALDHRWDSFIGDLNNARKTNGKRTTGGSENIKIPIRVGEYHKFNDGLVGYWIESEKGYHDDTFHSQQDQLSDSDIIRTHFEEPLTISRSFKDPALKLTMLMDPRAAIHVTCGVLPVKSIELPPLHYQDALENIEVTFLSAPVITEREQIKLPLPSEPDSSWSWLQLGKNGWEEFGTVPILTPDMLNDLTFSVPDLWNELLAAGWIKHIDSNKNQALVISVDKRERKTLSKKYQRIELSLEALFQRIQIGSIDNATSFGKQNVIREGWLRLRRLKNKTK